MTIKRAIMATAIAGIAATTPSLGVTIDQLTQNSGWATGLMYASRVQTVSGGLLKASGSFKIERYNNSDTQLTISGFLNHESTFRFVLTDDDGNETADGTQIRYAYDEQAVNGTRMSFMTGEWTGYKYTFGRNNANQIIEPYWIGKIQETEGGNYIIDFDIPVHYVTPTTSQIYHNNVLDHFTLETFTPNAYVTENVKRYTTTTDWWGEILGWNWTSDDQWTYPVRITTDAEAGTISILNFGNEGYAISKNHTPELITGTFTTADGFKTGSFELPADQPCIIIPLYADRYGIQVIMECWYILRSMDDDTVIRQQPISGSWANGVLTHDNDAADRWVTNDGTFRTYLNYSFDMDSYTHYNGDETGGMNFTDYYHNVHYDVNEDLTVDVDLDLQMVGLSATHIAVGGEIKTNKNHQYVDHYEIHIVPGHYKSINDAGFIHHAENGHANGKSVHNYNLDEHVYVINPSSRASVATDVRSNDYSFKKMIPFDDLGEGFNEDNKEYTAYIKTVYKPITEEDGTVTTLNPTFHSMQYIEQDQITAVDEIGIDFNDADTPKEYYNLQGMRVENPQAGNIYIVKKGSKVSKVRF